MVNKQWLVQYWRRDCSGKGLDSYLKTCLLLAVWSWTLHSNSVHLTVFICWWGKYNKVMKAVCKNLSEKSTCCMLGKNHSFNYRRLLITKGLWFDLKSVFGLNTVLPKWMLLLKSSSYVLFVLFLLRESNSLIWNLGNSSIVLFLVNNNML